MENAMTVEDNLAAHGIMLPDAFETRYAYAPLATNGTTLQLAGHIAKTGIETVRHQGPVGDTTNSEEATEDAAHCILQGLAAIKQQLGSLDRLSHPMHLNVYVATADDFTNISPVADGASRILLNAFGEQRGRHPRSVLGVRVLPRNASVMIDMTFALNP
jgi:enamine deaminase RidA (YjgF/YER057c/UK114 family)